MNADATFDFTGLKCPLPALMAKRAVARCAAGMIVAIVADDPLAHIDIPHMCAEQAIDILQTERDGDRVRLWLRRR